MPVLLTRIDDRLIHGQVVIGWGRPLGLERIVLVDDAVAANPWEQDLYRMAVPDGIEVDFATAREAAAQLAGWQASPRRMAVLTGDIPTMLAMLADGAPDSLRVNIGGLHHRPGRTERLPYVYLADAEWQALADLAGAGVSVSAQDVPTAPAVPLERLR